MKKLSGVLQALILGRKMHYTALGMGRHKNPKDCATCLPSPSEPWHARCGTFVCHGVAAKSGRAILTAASAEHLPPWLQTACRHMGFIQLLWESQCSKSDNLIVALTSVSETVFRVYSPDRPAGYPNVYNILRLRLHTQQECNILELPALCSIFWVKTHWMLTCKCLGVQGIEEKVNRNVAQELRWNFSVCSVHSSQPHLWETLFTVTSQPSEGQQACNLLRD